jgi:CxxC-x17-CxxC domain-containing protein
MPDQPLVCADCGTSFIFTESEQAFFAQRALAKPKRCKACRRARKSPPPAVSGVPPAFPDEDRSGTITAPPPPAGDSAGRLRVQIRCVECGVLAEVPFTPAEGRAVYCPACYRARKGSVRQATDGVELDESDEGIIE